MMSSQPMLHNGSHHRNMSFDESESKRVVVGSQHARAKLELRHVSADRATRSLGHPSYRR